MSDPIDRNKIIQRIRNELSIADVVGEELALTTSGRGFVVSCPWHSDTRPSLRLDMVRNSWKCWVCELEGDAINFVAKLRQITVDDAIVILAAKLK